jgi:hypothetical protein
MADVGISHSSEEITACCCSTIMAFEVQLHASLEAIETVQSSVDPDDLCAFAVNCSGVEVVHRNVRVGSDRM